MSKKYRGYDLQLDIIGGLYVAYIYLDSKKIYMTGGELTTGKAMEEAQKWVDESTECKPHGVLTCDFKDSEFTNGRRV